MIITAVVGTVLLVAVLTILLLQYTAGGGSTTSGGSGPTTNTNYLIASTVTGSNTAPAPIVGPFSSLVATLNFIPSITNMIWIAANQSLSLSPSWLSGANYTAITSNQLTIFTVPEQSSQTTMILGFAGFAFNNDTNLPMDVDIPYGASVVFSAPDAATHTVDISLPLTLPGTLTDYMVFATNGDQAANIAFFTGAQVIDPSTIRIVYYGAYTGLARVNFIILKSKTTTSLTRPLAYAETKTVSVTAPSGYTTTNITLQNPVPMSGRTNVWFAMMNTTTNTSTAYGIEQINDNTVAFSCNPGPLASVTVSYFCINGVSTATGTSPGAQFSY